MKTPKSGAVFLNRLSPEVKLNGLSVVVEFMGILISPPL